jgi:hypothetical protein
MRGNVAICARLSKNANRVGGPNYFKSLLVVFGQICDVQRPAALADSSTESCNMDSIQSQQVHFDDADSRNRPVPLRNHAAEHAFSNGNN